VDILILVSSNKANAEFPRNEPAEENKLSLGNGEDGKEQEGEDAEECFETNWD
jgi:hypothetical protein